MELSQQGPLIHQAILKTCLHLRNSVDQVQQSKSRAACTASSSRALRTPRRSPHGDHSRVCQDFLEFSSLMSSDKVLMILSRSDSV